jgi:hypothetical protein
MKSLLFLNVFFCWLQGFTTGNSTEL